MHFFVSSVTFEGKNSFDLLELQDYDSLIEYLEVREMIPTNITNIPSFIAPFIPRGGSKITPDDIIELMENLHLVIKSGLPLYQGIMDIAQDSENKRFKAMIEQIAFDINKGKSLAEAFGMYEDVIGIMILNLIKIGEETGELESTLKRGAEFLKRTTTLKKKAKSALIYPSFAFFAVSIAMLVWMIYVLPQMTSLFKDMDIELPPITVFIMALSDFLTHYIVSMIIGIVVFVVSFKIAYKKDKRVRIFVAKLLFKTPVVKQIISSFNIAFISEYLKLALTSGVPVFGALGTLKNNLNNELYKKALFDATKNVEKGSQISVAFKKTKMFTPFMIRMMTVGEEAGTLDTQLDIVSKFYYDKVDYFAENIGKIIEPIVLFLVGGFMALIMVGLMGPMYDLVSQMK